jgi:large subunit ribosomal protein L24
MQLKNPGKQRKNLFNAPAHIRHKQMAAPLSRELSASKGAKTLPVRKGDTVRIMRGDNKGFEGKVSRVDLKRYRLYMEGLTREKVDGTNIFLPIHPSKVEIRNLNLDDKYRKEILARKVALEKPAKKAEKPKAKAKKTEEAPVEEVENEEAANVEETTLSETKKAPAKDVAAKKAENEPEEKEAALQTRAKKASAKGGE